MGKRVTFHPVTISLIFGGLLQYVYVVTGYDLPVSTPGILVVLNNLSYWTESRGTVLFTSNYQQNQ